MRFVAVCSKCGRGFAVPRDGSTIILDGQPIWYLVDGSAESEMCNGRVVTVSYDTQLAKIQAETADA